MTSLEIASHSEQESSASACSMQRVYTDASPERPCCFLCARAAGAWRCPIGSGGEGAAEGRKGQGHPAFLRDGGRVVVAAHHRRGLVNAVVRARIRLSAHAHALDSVCLLRQDRATITPRVRVRAMRCVLGPGMGRGRAKWRSRCGPGRGSTGAAKEREYSDSKKLLAAGFGICGSDWDSRSAHESGPTDPCSRSGNTPLPVRGYAADDARGRRFSGFARSDAGRKGTPGRLMPATTI